jgi:hypothetical protein
LQHQSRKTNNKTNNQPEVAPSSPNFSLSISEKLSRYGVNALSECRTLGFAGWKETLAAQLLAHFGSLKTLAKVSAVELRSGNSLLLLRRNAILPPGGVARCLA